MIKNIMVVNYLTILLVFYFVTQFTMDIISKIQSDPSSKVVNHGIKETETDVFTPGISSLMMFIIWFTIIVSRDLRLGTESLPYFRINHPVYLNGFLQITGIVLVLIGVISANWSRIIRGTHSPNWGFKEFSRLITNGPYRYIRHPSYTFYFLVTTGLALLTQVLFVYILIWGVIQYSKVVSIEEKMLILQFGDEYVKYQAQTKKFIPYIW